MKWLHALTLLEINKGKKMKLSYHIGYVNGFANGFWKNGLSYIEDNPEILNWLKSQKFVKLEKDGNNIKIESCEKIGYGVNNPYYGSNENVLNMEILWSLADATYLGID